MKRANLGSAPPRAPRGLLWSGRSRRPYETSHRPANASRVGDALEQRGRHVDADRDIATICCEPRRAASHRLRAVARQGAGGRERTRRRSAHDRGSQAVRAKGHRGAVRALRGEARFAHPRSRTRREAAPSQAGTENVLRYIVGLGTACEIAAARSLPAETDRLPRAPRPPPRETARRASVDRVALNGHPEERLPNTLNVNFMGHIGAELLAKAPGVAASTGSACHEGKVNSVAGAGRDGRPAGDRCAGPCA